MFTSEGERDGRGHRGEEWVEDFAGKRVGGGDISNSGKEGRLHQPDTASTMATFNVGEILN